MSRLPLNGTDTISLLAVGLIPAGWYVYLYSHANRATDLATIQRHDDPGFYASFLDDPPKGDTELALRTDEINNIKKYYNDNETVIEGKLAYVKAVRRNTMILTAAVIGYTALTSWYSAFFAVAS